MITFATTTNNQSRHPERSSLRTLQAAQPKDPDAAHLTKTAHPILLTTPTALAVALAPGVGPGFSPDIHPTTKPGFSPRGMHSIMRPTANLGMAATIAGGRTESVRPHRAYIASRAESGITRLGITIFVVLATVLSNATSGSAESFDKPLRKTLVDLGQSPSQEGPAGKHFRVKLSCSYYQAFLIKQLDDDGLKGTRWVTIMPIDKGIDITCRRSHDPTERFVAKEWWSFIGVKGSLLFLEAADGDDNMGMPFRALRIGSGKRIFQDSARGDFDFAHNADGRLSLNYLRVVGVGCSIPKGGTSCWQRFTEKFGLAPAAVPKCVSYLGESTLTAQDAEARSVIAYPVSVELFSRPQVKAVSGSVKCNQL